MGRLCLRAPPQERAAAVTYADTVTSGTRWKVPQIQYRDRVVDVPVVMHRQISKIYEVARTAEISSRCGSLTELLLYLKVEVWLPKKALCGAAMALNGQDVRMLLLS